MLFLKTKLPYEYASKIEKMGADGDLDDAKSVFDEVKKHSQSLADELTLFLG